MSGYPSTCLEWIACWCGCWNSVSAYPVFVYRSTFCCFWGYEDTSARGGCTCSWTMLRYNFQLHSKVEVSYSHWPSWRMVESWAGDWSWWIIVIHCQHSAHGLSIICNQWFSAFVGLWRTLARSAIQKQPYVVFWWFICGFKQGHKGDAAYEICSSHEIDGFIVRGSVLLGVLWSLLLV